MLSGSQWVESMVVYGGMVGKWRGDPKLVPLVYQEQKQRVFGFVEFGGSMHGGIRVVGLLNKPHGLFQLNGGLSLYGGSVVGWIK